MRDGGLASRRTPTDGPAATIDSLRVESVSRAGRQDSWQDRGVSTHSSHNEDSKDLFKVPAGHETWPVTVGRGLWLDKGMRARDLQGRNWPPTIRFSTRTRTLFLVMRFSQNWENERYPGYI